MQQPAAEAGGPTSGGIVGGLAGVDRPLRLLREAVLLPFARHRELQALGGLEPPRGLLLVGPPGVGKTALASQMLAEALSAQPRIDARLFVVNGAEVISGVVGQAERNLRRVFEQAESHAHWFDGSGAAMPGLSIVFLDEADAICARRNGMGSAIRSSGGDSGGGGGSQVATRVVTQLLSLLDGTAAAAAVAPSPASARRSLGRVVVIAATNTPDAIDPALRRPGRFDREVRVDPPDAIARRAILASLTGSLRFCGGEAERQRVLEEVPPRCMGYVGGDLVALVREATAASALRVTAAFAGSAVADSAAAVAGAEGAAPGGVTLVDFVNAMGRVGASSLRGLSVAPAALSADTTWASVGGMGPVVRRIREAVEAPLLRAAAYKRMGLSVPRGLLLHGPPGNSKTTLVRALCAAVHATFFVLSGADVFSPYVGDAEKVIRTLFARARESVPAVIFLDEIDSLVGKRGIGGGASAGKGTVFYVSRRFFCFVVHYDCGLFLRSYEICLFLCRCITGCIGNALN
jgi:SpoVK/Ycf46/Vps4 family AAA+-type ATPase